MTQHNFKPTFVRNGLKSCIDHIYSNCSYKITDFVTQDDILSDYYILTFKYTNKHLNIKPTYRLKRDVNLLNMDILTYYCDMNDKIDTVFDYDTPNDIADILIIELNTIIQTIAPSRLIQYKNRYNKWYNKDIETQADIKNKAHDKAKLTNDPDDWRDFRRQRNKYNDDIKTPKNNYYYNRLTVRDKNDKNDIKLKDNLTGDSKL